MTQRETVGIIIVLMFFIISSFTLLDSLTRIDVKNNEFISTVTINNVNYNIVNFRGCDYFQNWNNVLTHMGTCSNKIHKENLK